MCAGESGLAITALCLLYYHQIEYLTEIEHLVQHRLHRPISHAAQSLAFSQLQVIVSLAHWRSFTFRFRGLRR